MKWFGLSFKRALVAGGVALGLMAAAGRTALAMTIRLKAQAVVEAHQDVRLGDVATVSDPDARKAADLANTVVLSGVEKEQNLTADSVLMALMAQRGTSALGSDLRMGGAANCRITIGIPAAKMVTATPVARSDDAQIVAAPVRAMGAADAGALQVVPGTLPAPNHAAAGAVDGQNPTLSQLITQQVQGNLNGTSDTVRIKIQTINPLLDSPIPPERKWLCRSITQRLLGTVEFQAQLVEGTNILQRLNVEAKVEMRQHVVVAVKRIARGDVISDAQVAMEDQWLDRKLPRLFAESHDVVGLEAARDVDVGGLLDERDFHEALMAHRNDVVSVIYIAGALKVQIRGRAMDDAKMHDRVDIRNETTGEHYSVVMIGRNLGVAGANLTPEQEKKLLEAQ